MSRRMKAWLAGGWLVLAVAGWSFTEAINDGIEPTSGPRPRVEPSASSPRACPVPPAPAPSPATTSSGHEIFDHYAEAESEPRVVVSAVACIDAD
ncbi:hypothetical protein [Streptomyces sp. uw30]|uniref:hypothetical protein n=1 Tax=Streptomyces sp. uw30 TaxID=1828179 RepID=UPI0011CEB2EF|nr:hypothetical protein [Streptomyces sp. uw30]